ncbi:DnaB-like helicase C-terminal domain-containing protein [Paenibacillus sp. p3-SID867]|nr:DnaB-like helicase C-terminal domain-containing protein [Paenibacillus sp. p3-SID867]
MVAARPFEGKTAFALNVTQKVAKSTDEAVALSSLEISEGQFARRLVSSEGQIIANTINNGDMHGSDWIKMAEAVGVQGETNIFLDNSSRISSHDICSKFRRLKKQQGLELVMIAPFFQSGDFANHLR